MAFKDANAERDFKFYKLNKEREGAENSIAVLTTYSLIIGFISLMIFGNMLFIWSFGKIYPTAYQYYFGFALSILCIIFSIGGYYVARNSLKNHPKES